MRLWPGYPPDCETLRQRLLNCFSREIRHDINNIDHVVSSQSAGEEIAHHITRTIGYKSLEPRHYPKRRACRT